MIYVIVIDIYSSKEVVAICINTIEGSR